MAFLETPRFPDDISFGAVGGAGYKNRIAQVNSGHEQVFPLWPVGLGEWEVSHAARTKTRFAVLNAYFRAVGGQANRFRFKDWTDFQVDVSAGRIGTSAVGTGYPTGQLIKRYSAGALYEDRETKKPVAGTVAIYKNAVLQTPTTHYTLDTTTGIVTWVPTSTKAVNANIAKAITGLTQANPGVVTAVGHGFATGDKIKLTSVGGMVEVNDLYFTITYIGPDTFSIGVNTTAYTAYTSGGTATKYGITQTSPVRVHSTAHGFTNGQIVYLAGAAGMTQVNGLAFTVSGAATDYFELSGINGTAYTTYTGSASVYLYPQPADALTWSGEFDVPCRFGVDNMRAEVLDKSGNELIIGWSSIPIVEVRV